MATSVESTRPRTIFQKVFQNTCKATQERLLKASSVKALFKVDLLTRTWKYGETRLFRAEKLYTAQNYQTFIEAFRKSFPDYVYYDPFRGKELISAPLSSIETVYVPKDCLVALKKVTKPDELQKLALNLLDLISKQS